MQDVCFEADLTMLRQVASVRSSPRAIVENLIPESLLPQIRDLLLGDTSQSGGRGVPGGRIVGVVCRRGRKRENLRDSFRLLATDCTNSFLVSSANDCRTPYFNFIT
jgi:hypothetical protein